MDVFEKSLELHAKLHGVLEIALKTPVDTREDLSLAYTPGVAEPCRKIQENPEDAYVYTMKCNTVAVVTDGSAVLGLGNIGSLAGLPVMEGKCLLLKRFGNVDAFPICLDTQDVEEIIATVKHIAPGFGGIHLEDISAPRCFEIEERLKKELDIPVFHDDQHGTAVVVLAGLINALKLVDKKWDEAKIVISGAGAAAMATTKLLLLYGAKNVILCDRQGAIYLERADLTNAPYKLEMARVTNPNKEKGTLAEVVKGADVFVGVSAPGLMTKEMVATMAPKSIVFAMANPTPEIMPDEAKAGGAYIVGTGRSDYPNQINNVLSFPGIFRGVLDARAPQITNAMKLAAAKALAEHVTDPTVDKIIPGVFDDGIAELVANAVKKCA
ncbi:MAG: NADP-dependent malic enzyme [Candidatus Gracilibacteria bacterium]|jgi:malate dehydrogenase (oxaloacetate-decarboxylating)